MSAFTVFTSLILVLGFSSTSFAKNFCVKNAKEFNEKKTEIPEVFHGLPEKSVHFTIDKMLVTGGLKVSTLNNGQFLFEGYFRKGFSYYEDRADIQEICFKGDHVIVNFGKGKEPYKALVENTGISIDSYLISANANGSNYEKIKNKIVQTIANQTSTQHGQGVN